MNGGQQLEEKIRNLQNQTEMYKLKCTALSDELGKRNSKITFLDNQLNAERESLSEINAWQQKQLTVGTKLLETVTNIGNGKVVWYSN